MSGYDDGFDIPAMLADRVLALVCELLPGGIREGNYFRAGSVYGEKGQSLVVCLAGPRRGRWRDYADVDVYGDLVDLIAFTKTNRDLKKAFAWAREWLGLPPLAVGFAPGVRSPATPRALPPVRLRPKPRPRRGGRARKPRCFAMMPRTASGRGGSGTRRGRSRPAMWSTAISKPARSI